MNRLKQIRLKWLLHTLNSFASHKRKVKAIKALGKIGGSLAFDALAKILDSYPEAAEALGNMGDARAVSRLLVYLSSGEPAFRLAAAKALSKLGENKWQSIIRGDDSDYERLVRSGDGRIIRLLTPELAPSSAMFKPLVTRNKLVRQALINSRDESVVQVFRTILKDPRYRGKQFVIDSLGDFQDKGSVPDLITCLHSNWKEERKSAAIALGKIGDPLAIEPLKERLADVYGEVRTTAAEALDKLGEPRWKNLVQGDSDDFEKLGESGIQMIMHLLIQIIDPNIQQKNQLFPTASYDAWLASVKGLGKLGNPAAIEPLKKYLSNISRPLRKAAAQALSPLGEPLWETIIKGDERDFKRLANSGHAFAWKVLVEAINNHEKLGIKIYDDKIYQEERDLAIKSLISITNPGAVETLMEALTNRKNCAEARWNAAIALGNIGDPRAVVSLTESFKLFDDSLHKEIADALGKIGDSRAVPAIIDQLNIAKEKIQKEIHEGTHKSLNKIWKHFDSRNKEKLISIVLALGKIGSADVVEPLLGLLSYRAIQVRKLAAETLIDLAKYDFSLVANHWAKISSLNRQAHHDHEDGVWEWSCEFHSDTIKHTDTGIGLEIPTELNM